MKKILILGVLLVFIGGGIALGEDFGARLGIQYNYCLALLDLDSGTQPSEAIDKIFQMGEVEKRFVPGVNKNQLKTLPPDPDPDFFSMAVIIYAVSNYNPKPFQYIDGLDYLNGWFMREKWHGNPENPQSYSLYGLGLISEVRGNIPKAFDYYMEGLSLMTNDETPVDALILGRLSSFIPKDPNQETKQLIEQKMNTLPIENAAVKEAFTNYLELIKEVNQEKLIQILSENLE